MVTDSRKSAWLQIIGHAIMILVTAAMLAPFILMIVSSITDDATLVIEGYRFLPKKVSFEAYRYIFQQWSVIGRGYLITVVVTLVGTTLSLAITSMLGYVLSRRDFPAAGWMTIAVVITILFNGGLVPTYLMYTRYLGLKNSLLALLIPGLLMNGFNVFLMRTYYRTSIPMALIEASKIDGAGEFFTFLKIVLPLSMPILATVGLLVGLAYWNDWFNGLIYINKPELYSIQLILNTMLQDIQFLINNAMVSGEAGDAIARIPSTSIRMAIAVIGSLPVLLAFPFFQRYFIKGITLGAVKG
jgi:putative aldouronate transport system permease protein